MPESECKSMTTVSDGPTHVPWLLSSALEFGVQLSTDFGCFVQQSWRLLASLNVSIMNTIGRTRIRFIKAIQGNTCLNGRVLATKKMEAGRANDDADDVRCWQCSCELEVLDWGFQAPCHRVASK